MIRPPHSERHFVDRIGWLRAAVLGANDGIVSTASLIVGVAAAAATWNYILIAGVAGLVAGAMSMAAGEYVSVSSQSDTETAELARERKELEENVEFELDELTTIYIKRGVEPALARQVAQQLMAKDALTAHARDELGISEITTARPVQAAFRSAATFSIGAAMPLLMVFVSPPRMLVPVVSIASLGFLALLGAVGAKAGGANIMRATILGRIGHGHDRRHRQTLRRSRVITRRGSLVDKWTASQVRDAAERELANSQGAHDCDDHVGNLRFWVWRGGAPRASPYKVCVLLRLPPREPPTADTNGKRFEGRNALARRPIESAETKSRNSENSSVGAEHPRPSWSAIRVIVSLKSVMTNNGTV